MKGADFQETSFESGKAFFQNATFKGRTLFTSRKEKDKTIQIFSSVEEVNFTSVIIDPSDSLTFVEADLMKCFFLNTNLQKVNFFAVDWPKIKGRFGVYDEEKFRSDDKIGGELAGKGQEDKEKNGKKRGERSVFLAQLERLYRELKKNYEDNRDYERAGHFHYGEKEMRRKNPKTSKFLKLLLTLYLWFSGYGESVVRPLIWTVILLAVSTIGYLWFGLFPAGGKQLLSWNNFPDWLAACLYSLRVIFFQKPDDMTLAGLGARAVHTVQAILGPLFIALFALAVRQKLKR